MTKGKLIIVSNRLPVTVLEKEDGPAELKPSSGGLVSGLREIHDQSDSVWVGHLGQLPQGSSIEQFLEDNNLVDVPIKPKVYDRYYNGYSNR